jgi:DNA (cytosine-5)-methyltransferase 1
MELPPVKIEDHDMLKKSRNMNPDMESTHATKTRNELIALCKERGIKGYSNKKKEELLALVESVSDTIASATVVPMKPPIHEKKPFRVLSLFSGMGGMDVGFAEQVVVHNESLAETSRDWIDPVITKRIQMETDEFVALRRLPFQIVFQNDILPEAKRIAELNGWAHNYHLKDIRQILADSDELPTADIVTGGFPCQDFSHAGKRKGFDSQRGTLYQAYVEVVRRVRPLIFVAENVHGLLTMPGEPILQIMSDFAEVGYNVKYQLIKCEEHGIPQTRWRVMIIGVRNDLGGLSEEWNCMDENRIGCSVGWYFRHLDEPDDTKDPAQKIYSKAARLEKGQGQKEVGWNEFGPTMRAEHHGNIEFRRINGGKNEEIEGTDKKERRLTVREAALIQTFSPSCILTEPRRLTSMAYRPIGNAVPPLLGYLMARKVLALLAVAGIEEAPF